ncbi:MAG: S41 family peptidase [Lachnospiraceae bacterium]|nr:S41 family peptidase [Lachnospiraceae bacterium]
MEENKKKNNKGLFAAGIFVGMAIIIAISGIAVNITGMISELMPGEKDTASVSDDPAVRRKIKSVEKLIDKYYVEEIDRAAEEEGIYKGIIDSLDDKYSTYYTAEEMEKTLEDSAGEYGGIGCYIAYDTVAEHCYVAGIIPGYSADNAGLLEGDIFYKVDDEIVLDCTSEEVSNRVRGPEGTTVDLVMVRDGKEMEYTLVRALVEIQSVSINMADEKNKIGYMQIASFDLATRDQFHYAMDELEAEDVNALIIDLRDNPGGDVDVATNMAERLLPEGLIIYTEDKNGKRDEYKGDGKNEFKKPIVLLVNGNSASAAEIFAGALKDYDKATLVGEKTYGKGVVQVVVPMTDGSAVKLTTAKYYLPKGECIHGKGIEPDVKVELDVDAYRADGTDNQKEEALKILREKLKK